MAILMFNRRSFLSVLFAALTAGAQGPPEWRWNFNDLNIKNTSTAPEPASWTGPPKAVPHFILGRHRYGLALSPAYPWFILTLPRSLDRQRPLAFRCFLRPDRLDREQMVVSSDPEAGAGSLRLTLAAGGQVELRVGAADGRELRLRSGARLGAQAWHQVAWSLAGSGVTLFLDGKPEAWADLAGPDRPGPVGALRIGAAADPHAPVPFQGGIDQLAICAAPLTPALLAQLEPGLALRAMVLADLRGKGLLEEGEDLGSPSFRASSILRAYVHTLVDPGDAGRLPPDPLPLKEMQRNGFERYVFSGGLERGPDGAYPSLYLNLAAKVRTGYCGALALTLWGVYKAFGFQPENRDYIHRNRLDSHVLTEVFVTEQPGRVMQDPTYDLCGRWTGPRGQDRYLGLDEVAAFAGRWRPGCLFPFGDGGFAFTWLQPAQPLDQAYYLGYFDKLNSRLTPDHP